MTRQPRASGPRFGSDSRPGFTLVELLATLGILMVLGVAAAKLLTSVTDIGVQTGKNKMARATIVRLAEDLRADVTTADSTMISENGSRLEIQANDHQVNYVIDLANHSVDRIASQGTSQLSRERFSLAERCVPEFSARDKIIRLRLMPETHSTPWTIEAVKP